jgi:ribonuclease BN (tRNA processing enzyme)
VRITPVPSAVCSPHAREHQFLTSYLVNDSLAIDAGCLGLYGDPAKQRRIRHILVTHTHIDHLASLPIFLEELGEDRSDPVTIHGNEAVLDCLRRDIFNDRVWPDLIRLAATAGPFFHLAPLRDGEPLELEGVRITPVALNHVVPTLGFILEQDGTAMVLATDTGPTEAIWQRARKLAGLRAVFLEATFPNAMDGFARLAQHLTPAMCADELAKLGRPVRTIVVHIKVGYRAQVVRELEALGMPDLEIAQLGMTYEF